MSNTPISSNLLKIIYIVNVFLIPTQFFTKIFIKTESMSSLEKKFIKNNNNFYKKTNSMLNKNILETLNDKNYMNYCSSNYMFDYPDKNYTTYSNNINHLNNNTKKLKKLIVINRHGDRMPINLEQPFIFDLLRCVKCNNKECLTKNCHEGDLTLKGYEQLRNLGRHLAEKYNDFFIRTSENEILLRTSSIERTKTSLFGLLEGLKEKLVEKGIEMFYDPKIKEDFMEELETNTFESSIIGRSIANIFPLTDSLKLISPLTPKPEKDSLLSLKNCPAFSKVLNETYKNNIIHNTTNIDESLVAMCNDIEESCRKYECDEFKKITAVKNFFDSWKEHTKIIKENNILLKMYFGRFAGDFLDFLDNQTKMEIISTHDNSLSLILAGLKTDFFERPPLASAIFLEIWTNNKNEDFLRIIFNNKILKSDIYHSRLIPLKIVREYLKMMSINEKGLKEMCQLN